jgi:hypothetical protein
VPTGCAEAVRTPATWNEQLDEILVRVVDERGEHRRLYPDSRETLPKASARIRGCSWQIGTVWDPVVSRSLEIKRGCRLFETCS